MKWGYENCTEKWIRENESQTLLGMARSMLNFKKLRHLYLVEAIHTTDYLRNISPTSSLDGITPYEAWLGFKPLVKHLRVICEFIIF